MSLVCLTERIIPFAGVTPVNLDSSLIKTFLPVSVLFLFVKESDSSSKSVCLTPVSFLSRSDSTRVH